MLWGSCTWPRGRNGWRPSMPLPRAVVEAREERLPRHHRQLCRGPRRRLVLRLDRRPEAAAGRRLLAAAIHAAQAGQQVVEDQPRQGGSSDRGRPNAAGLREVEAAKADGRWAAAYDGQSTATVPDDLRQAWTRMRTPRPSSPRSTAGTAMPSCTESTRPRSRRPERPASLSSSRCCTITRPCIPFRPATARAPPGTDRCGSLRIAAGLATSEQFPVAHLADKARPHHPAHQVPLPYKCDRAC